MGSTMCNISIPCFLEITEVISVRIGENRVLKFPNGLLSGSEIVPSFLTLSEKRDGECSA